MTSQTIILDSEERRARAIKVLSLVSIEKPLEVLVRPYIPKRSDSQNRRLHKLFGLVADAIGDDLESVKLAYKAKFLKGDEKEIYGLKVMEGRLFLSGAYSYLGFNEATEAFVSSDEQTHEQSVEPVNASIALFPGIVLGAGYALVLVDQKNQTDTAIHGNEQIFYANLSWNGAWEF